MKLKNFFSKEGRLSRQKFVLLGALSYIVSRILWFLVVMAFGFVIAALWWSLINIMIGWIIAYLLVNILFTILVYMPLMNKRFHDLNYDGEKKIRLISAMIILIYISISMWDINGVVNFMNAEIIKYLTIFLTIICIIIIKPLILKPWTNGNNQFGHDTL